MNVCKSRQKGINMEVKHIISTARSATIEISDGGIYFTKQKYNIIVNGEPYGEAEQVITSIYELKPDTDYKVEIQCPDTKEIVGSVDFKTKYEFVTLNVREFGAKGDGVQDDTTFIQVAIMACPKESRVLIPAGTYKITSLFLKSDLNLELAKGAELLAENDRFKYPIFPGLIESYDETDEYNLGTWEGNPLPMFTGIVTGIYADNIVLYGQGSINGNASKENWWYNEKVMVGAFRPRTLFLSHCSHVVVQGLKLHDSPAWTIHPYFSNHLKFYNLIVENPSDSPNTDGLDPESCKDVRIEGIRFSLGDDCIAVKSGKIYMGKKYKTPSEDMVIRQCLMENGHGAVTVGSEMAGGVKNMVVEECLFRHTDRGLRIKTRRGRGRDAVIDGIVFRNLKMDHVMTPLVVNCFYFCDPDGRTEYVQSRESYPVDERTPSIKKMDFEKMECTNCHVAAAFFDGLPEEKIEEIHMEDILFTYAENPKSGVPAMSNGVEECTKRGIFASNVKRLILKNVSVTGQDGDAVELHGVDRIERG